MMVSTDMVVKLHKYHTPRKAVTTKKKLFNLQWLTVAFNDTSTMSNSFALIVAKNLVTICIFQ